MSKETLALIVGLVQEAVKDTPELVIEFRKIFNVTNPATTDWQALKDKVASESYEQYVPASQIPKP
jgi:hypothetical protein